MANSLLYPNQTVVESFIRLCDGAETPFAYRAGLLARSQQWGALVALKVPIHLYRCVKTLSCDLQIAAYLKKFPGFDLGLDLEAKAVKSFWDSEQRCYQTNERLSPLLFDVDHYGSALGKAVKLWQREIRRVLGRVPTIASLVGKFGPGSTFRNVGDDVTVAHKLNDDYTLTRRATCVLHSWDTSAWGCYASSGLMRTNHMDLFRTTIIGSDGSWYHPMNEDDPHAIRDIEYVRGNRFTTVPKESTKLRGICIEPSINVFYQLAVGAFITKALHKAYGWSKETTQQYHQLLARLGSLTGSNATIDLSSASDTICSNLVKLLLPPEWYRLVDDLRSHYTLIEGKWVKLEKFSSMGNGFTFELETLIFWTLARVIAQIEPSTEDPHSFGLDISVFGDDIIVPRSIARPLIAALRFFGFATNEDKTFIDGLFRESCGGDFWSGYDVRPHYVKEDPNEPQHYISLANGIRRFMRRHHHCGGDNRRFHRARFSVLDAIPKHIRSIRGPEELGDLVIHEDETGPHGWSSPENAKRNIRERNSRRYFRCYRPIPNRVIGWDQWRPGVVMACALYGVPSGTPSYLATSDSSSMESWAKYSGVIRRIDGSYVSGHKVGRVSFS